MRRPLDSFALAALALTMSACAAQAGGLCQQDRDCAEGLRCCSAAPSSSEARRGRCQIECTVIDAGIQDAATVDGGPGEDAGSEDAAMSMEDAAMSMEDAAVVDAAVVDAAMVDAAAATDAAADTDAGGTDAGETDGG